MNDLDDGLREVMSSLAGHMPATDLADTAMRVGRQRKARRSTLAIVSVCAAVAAVVVPLALIARGSAGSTVAPTTHESTPSVVTAPNDGQPQLSQFDVAPAPVTIVGGGLVHNRACRPAEIRGNAGLRQSPDGVVGVVNLTSPARCTIHLGAVDPTLLDQDNQPLGISVVANSDTTNTAENAGWIPQPSFGFAWNGSWCGRPATSIQVPLRNGTIRINLAGPQPECAGTSNSVIIPGATGFNGDPLEGAPSEWRFLTVALSVNRSTPTPTLYGLALTFTNHSDQPVQLAPTPTYYIGVRDKYGDGTQAEANHPLVIATGSDVVPAHGTLHLSLPAESIVQDYWNLRGGRITVTFEMAGVPTATATTNVYR